MPPRSPRRHLTLVLCTLLHTFTHAYGTMLVPLYLMIVADLRLGGVKAASAVVTVYGLVYNAASYGAGVLADRADRKVMLGVGLLGNAAAVLLMGLTRDYPALLALGATAGLFGTLFHPAAGALAPEHYPRSPGMAIGLLGVGAGLGFFIGPQYAGWRARHGAWRTFAGLGPVADWQRPCVELGLAGLATGVLFLLLAREARPAKARTRRVAAEIFPAEDVAAEDFAARRAPVPPPQAPSGTAGAPPPAGAYESPAHPPLGRPLRRRVLAVAAVLGCRDFAGIANLTLASVYLQKAQGLSVDRTGFILGAMTLLSVVMNPLCVFLSPGRRRLPALVAVLLAGAAVIATLPLWPVAYALGVLTLFQAFHLGSYAISDAAMLERVPAAVRGRVVGLFLTLAGTFAATGPWIMGRWTDRLGERAGDPHAYLLPFGALAALMAAASLSAVFIRALGPATAGAVSPISEIDPGTREAVG